MKKLLSLCLMIILSSGFFQGCKKDKGDPPILPPQESMIIDFSNFDSQAKSANLTSGSKGIENSNWDFAAGVAIIWKLIINTTLIVPVSSFKLAMNQSPVYLSQNNWQWSYNVTVASVTYKARLTGVIGAGNVTWKMFITKEGAGGYTDFLWFEGTSKPDGSSGQWILYESYQSPSAILQIDWTKSGASVGTVKYTYIKNGTFKTSNIEYGLTNNTLNAYYTVHYYNSSLLKFSDVYVEWSTTNLNGRVKSLNYLGDIEWYCWDQNKVNIVCP
jgi:hypothetical protein